MRAAIRAHPHPRPFLAGSALLLAGLIGCAHTPRPVLYPNDTYRQVGDATAQEEISHCMLVAEEQGLPIDKQPEEGVREGARQSVIGGLIGGAIGWVLGNPGRGAAAGAAGRGTAGAIRGYEGSGANDPIFRRFVETCLADKGFRVIGWK